MTEKKKRKGGWFWLGVALLAIVGLFWVTLLIPVILDQPEEALYAVGGLLLMSAIPIAIGAYCVSRGKTKTSEEGTRAGAEPSARDTEAEIVTRAPSWFGGAGWFVLVLGTSCLAFACLMHEWGHALIFIGVGLFSFLGAICIFCSTTKVAFDRPPGYISVTLGWIPVFLWFLRYKVVSREEARSVHVLTGEREVSHDPLFGYIYGQPRRVELELKSGKKIRILVWSPHEADRLTQRILEFGQQ